MNDERLPTAGEPHAHLPEDVAVHTGAGAVWWPHRGPVPEDARRVEGPPPSGAPWVGDPVRATRAQRVEAVVAKEDVVEHHARSEGVVDAIHLVLLRSHV